MEQFELGLADAPAGLRLVPKACTQLRRHQRAHFLYSAEDLFAQRCDRYVTKVSKRPRQETQ
jgi:hypothetical protein